MTGVGTRPEPRQQMRQGTLGAAPWVPRWAIQRVASAVGAGAYTADPHTSRRTGDTARRESIGAIARQAGVSKSLARRCLAQLATFNEQGDG